MGPLLFFSRILEQRDRGGRTRGGTGGEVSWGGRALRPRHIHHTTAASFSSPPSLVWRSDSDATTKPPRVRLDLGRGRVTQGGAAIPSFPCSLLAAHWAVGPTTAARSCPRSFSSLHVHVDQAIEFSPYFLIIFLRGFFFFESLSTSYNGTYNVIFQY